MQPQTAIELCDGRRLAYATSGPRDGFAIFYLHGAIGSPLRRSVELDALIAELGIRYVTVSRPGFGGSDTQPGRTMLDFAADVGQLADVLQTDSFGVVGVSAGGPYALACAHALAPRITAVAVVSSLSALCPPYAVPGLPRRLRLAMTLLAKAPRLAVAVGDRALRIIERNPSLLPRLMTAGAPSADRRLLDEPDTCATAVDGFLAAGALGTEGMVDDYLLTTRPWGFDPADIATEVHLWHGVQDTLVPVEHALQLAVALPNCRPALDPDEGHYFFRRRLAAILGALAETAPPPHGSATRVTGRRSRSAGR